MTSATTPFNSTVFLKGARAMTKERRPCRAQDLVPSVSGSTLFPSLALLPLPKSFAHRSCLCLAPRCSPQGQGLLFATQIPFKEGTNPNVFEQSYSRRLYWPRRKNQRNVWRQEHHQTFCCHDEALQRRSGSMAGEDPMALLCRLRRHG